MADQVSDDLLGGVQKEGADDDDDFNEEPEDSFNDDLGGLISFANLENIMKHIIKKFHTLQLRNDSNDNEMSHMKKELEERSTIAMLDEMGTELRAKVEHVSKLLGSQKDSISSLENSLDRNKVLCSTIDKKLEAQAKEKAVQDRLIRETQDALQDKVAVAELNMFEAKFAGYTTKLEHQEVINMLGDYTRVDVTERVAESVKVLAHQFDGYTRTAKIEAQLQDLRNWVNGELLNYAKASSTQEKVQQLSGEIRDQALAFERVNSLMEDKLRGLSDRLTSTYSELSDDIHQRALAEHLQDVQQDLKKYALRAETDAFQQDCVPKLKFCVDSIRAFDERLKAQDGAIQRVDEVLLDKAGKYDIVVANARIDQCFQKDKAMQEFQRMYERLEWMNKRLEHYIDTETERMNQFRPPDYGPMFEDINERVKLKADKADLVEIYQLKANRIDSDELAKLQDMIHRQLEYLAVTTYGLSMLSLTEAKASESKTLRAQQKAQVLMQSKALWHWIIQNEPPPNLDVLRPPGAAQRSKSKERDTVVDSKEAAVADREKRVMDNHKRLQLERKLGIDTV